MAQQPQAAPRRGGHASTSSIGGTSSDSSSLPPTNPPARPERSQRRPVGAASPSTNVAIPRAGPSETGRFGDGSAAGRMAGGAGGGGGPGKNQRMMEQLRGYGTGADPSSPMMDTPDLGASTSSSIHFAPRATPALPSSSGSQLGNASRRRGDEETRPGGGNDDGARSSASSSPTSSRAGSPSRRPSNRDNFNKGRHEGGPSPASTPQAEVPAALQNAISAFSTAGKKRADGRRGGLADQGRALAQEGDSAGENATPTTTTRKALNPDEYPDTPAFRQVDDVLRRVKDEWPNLVRGTSLATRNNGGEDGGGDEEDAPFDPVSLALELLEPERSRNAASSGGDGSSSSSRRQNLSSFLRLKSELDSAIKSTLSPRMNPPSALSPTASGDAYRAYETAITTHNATLSTLTSAQKLVGGMRTGLVGTRERLEGQGKEGLAGMYARLGMLEEMGSLLDEIESLLRLPPSLETLLAEKRFLSAVVLLVRCNKALRKPDLMEIGALADLRAWAVAQEGVVLDILIEELHNHLYLKSFYTDVRWRSYTRGQTSLPVVDFGDDADNSFSNEPPVFLPGRSTARLPRMSKLQRFLQNLALKPAGADPAVDETLEELLVEPGDLGGSAAAAAAAALGETTEQDGIGTDGGLDGLGGTIGSGGGGASSSRKESGGTQRPNPEVDSFAYIEMLLEALAALGKLGYALDAVGQRIQGELFALVESTIEEVEERNDSIKPFANLVGSMRPASSLYVPPSPDPNHPSSTSLQGSTATTTTSGIASLSAISGAFATDGVAALLRLTPSETSGLANSVETLRDLFWTLYSKLDAVLQGFRVAYEVAGRIAERRDFKEAALLRSSSGNFLFSLLDLWRPLQQEVRALLHDYLTDEQDGTVTSRNPIVSVNEVLRFPRPRDASKQIFRFADTDLQGSHKLLQMQEASLNAAIKEAVPGLLTDGALSTTTASALIVGSSVGGNRSSSLNGTHKALVPSDAFNVSVLFVPTLAFLERVKEIMPGGLIADDEVDASTGFGGFLDDFVLRTYLPQLEEKVAQVFQQAVGGMDAFQDDPNYKRFSTVPIARSVTNLINLISSLCSMLRSTPFHRENYSQLIVGVTHQFYQCCLERFRDLAGSESPESSTVRSAEDLQLGSLRTAAAWADSPDLHACLRELKDALDSDQTNVPALLARETKIELERKGNRAVQEADLIQPSKKLGALATLHSSLIWFAGHVASLRSAPSGTPGYAFSSSKAGLRDSVYSNASTDTAQSTHSGHGEDTDHDTRPEGFALPLTNEMVKPFDALLDSYQQLANMVLYTLRLELRLRTMHYLDKATRDGVYQLQEDILEPDPSVVDLNSDLAECDELVGHALLPRSRRFVFEGLSPLMDDLLIRNARHIRLANRFGQHKMLRNILALQQNLKTLGDEPLQVNFDRSRRFWELFEQGPKTMLELARTNKIKYDFDDLKALLNLQCGIDQSGKDGAAAQNGGTPLMGSDATLPQTGSGDKARRQYNEYLIELFSLDPTGGMADE
ncbi:hypothetical protein JCM10908_002254 [Rhodotorula pacifica]|uniref:exocyst subunit SEC8 n=1 Tax=Rhodotorula pacifica TaxID=1495444 RepID=UPI00317D5C96